MLVFPSMLWGQRVLVWKECKDRTCWHLRHSLQSGLRCYSAADRIQHDLTIRGVKVSTLRNISKIASQEQPFSSTKGLFAIQPLHLRRPPFFNPPFKPPTVEMASIAAPQKQQCQGGGNFGKSSDPSGKNSTWHLALDTELHVLAHLNLFCILRSDCQRWRIWQMSDACQEIVFSIEVLYKLWHIFDIMCDLWLQFVSNMYGNSL